MKQEHLDLIIERGLKAYEFNQTSDIPPIERRHKLIEFFSDIYQVQNNKINVQNRNIDETDKRVVYRGIHDIDLSNYVKMLKQDDFNMYRFGVIGYGAYFASDYKYALRFAENDENNILKATLNKDAKFIEFNTIRVELISFLNDLKSPNKYPNLDKDFKTWFDMFINNNKEHFSSIFSHLLGYDGIKAYDTERRFYNVCVTNPKAVDIIYNENSK